MQWKDSVQRSSHKYTIPASDEKLSNSLGPCNISSRDTRVTSGTTHYPASKSAPFDRSVGYYSGWNISTLSEAQEVKAGLDTIRVDAHSNSLKAAARLKASTYISPIRRQELVIEKVRAVKKEQGADMVELEAMYGEEGAQAMLHILSLPKKARSHARPRPRPADLEAVLALNAFEDPLPPPDPAAAAATAPTSAAPSLGTASVDDTPR